MGRLAAERGFQVHPASLGPEATVASSPLGEALRPRAGVSQGNSRLQARQGAGAGDRLHSMWLSPFPCVPS